MAMQNNSLSDLWNRTVDLVKDKTNNISLWETLEQTVPITMEEDTLIIGINSENLNNPAQLTNTDYKNTIETSLARTFGKTMKFRVIEGTTLDDWKRAMEREMRVATMQNTTYKRSDIKSDTAHSWDGIFEYVSRSYNAMSMRQLPQMRARYLTDILYALSDVMDELYGDNPSETSERQLARVLEKIAALTEIPAPSIALELERLRAWQKQSDS